MYIDGGSHKGKTVFERLRTHPGEIIHAFEPNPFIDVAYPDKVHFHRRAIWTHDGPKYFYLSRLDKKSESSSVYKDKTFGCLDKKNPVVVEAIDFSTWIRYTVGTEQTCTLKLDIEGAEYPVLEKMLSEGTISLITELYVERHFDRVGISAEFDRDLFDRIRAEGVSVYDHP